MIIISQDKDAILNFDNIEAIRLMRSETEQRNLIAIDMLDGERYSVARYETEERAKEVLTQIIDTYKGKTIIKFRTVLGKDKLDELMQLYEYAGVIVQDETYKTKETKKEIYYMPER